MEVLNSEGDLLIKFKGLQNYDYLLGLSEDTLFTAFKATLMNNEVHADLIGFNQDHRDIYLRLKLRALDFKL